MAITRATKKAMANSPSAHPNAPSELLNKQKELVTRSRNAKKAAAADKPKPATPLPSRKPVQKRKPSDVPATTANPQKKLAIAAPPPSVPAPAPRTAIGRKLAAKAKATPKRLPPAATVTAARPSSSTSVAAAFPHHPAYPDFIPTYYKVTTHQNGREVSFSSEAGLVIKHARDEEGEVDVRAVAGPSKRVRSESPETDDETFLYGHRASAGSSSRSAAGKRNAKNLKNRKLPPSTSFSSSTLRTSPSTSANTSFASTSSVDLASSFEALDEPVVTKGIQKTITAKEIKTPFIEEDEEEEEESESESETGRPEVAVDGDDEEDIPTISSSLVRNDIRAELGMAPRQPRETAAITQHNREMQALFDQKVAAAMAEAEKKYGSSMQLASTGSNRRAIEAARRTR